ncbi:hypothetical protein B4146_3619 [Bacillus subtilis]|uniref:Uncharacterized protein n=1 Tax=Bacillus subtilis TaxID=1423 RepID=A0AAP1DZP8_BACIU|nr:hypothetical protein B4146_3619 [Bacillus subtilis]KZD90192.1 hypothetical protein B4122_3113 [Bacillus subtilis]
MLRCLFYKITISPVRNPIVTALAVKYAKKGFTACKKLIAIRMQLNMNGSKKISDMIQIEPFLINKQKSRGQAALLFI